MSRPNDGDELRLGAGIVKMIMQQRGRGVMVVFHGYWMARTVGSPGAQVSFEITC